MNERPILFSDPMVRAILEGRKTQTRRVVRHQRLGDYRPMMIMRKKAWDGTQFQNAKVSEGYGGIGDRLWVRETWRVGAWREDAGLIAVDYRADDSQRREWLHVTTDDSSEIFNRLWQQSTDDAMAAGLETGADDRYKWEPGKSPCRWRPSIFMPRWASRITLEVTGVRVERLQEITQEDVFREGLHNAQQDETEKRVGKSLSAQQCYRDLWDSINAERGYGWDKNPWVWVVEFKRAA